MAALGAIDNQPAQADGDGVGVAPAKPKTHHKDLYKREPLLFSAQDLNYDNRLNIVIARGHVEISQAGRTVFADVISYNQNTDSVIASGHVTLVEPSGDNISGNYVELTNDLHDGFIKDIRILMADRSRAAANYGRRTNGNWTELRQAIYSPCDVCVKDPAEAPTWQLKAERIDHDQHRNWGDTGHVYPLSLPSRPKR